MHLNNRNIQAIIFDLDGVVLDSMPYHVEAWRAAFKEFNLKVEPDFILRHEGALDRDLLKRRFACNGQQVEPELFDEIYDRQRKIYSTCYAARVSVFPEAARLLSLLSRTRIRTALVTSSRREVLPPKLWTWLKAFFSPLITGDQVQRSKPHPDPYLKALAELGLQADGALAVENAPAGIASVRAAGLTCVALTTTLPPEELIHADIVLEDHISLSHFLIQEGIIDIEMASPNSAKVLNKTRRLDF